MPFNIKQALEATRPVQVSFEGQTLKIDYRIGRYTSSLVKSLADKSSESQKVIRTANGKLTLCENQLGAAQERVRRARLDDSFPLDELETLNKNVEDLLKNVETEAEEVTKKTNDAISTELDTYSDHLPGLIASWDAEDEHGQSLDITSDVLKDNFPLVLQQAIFQVIQEANKLGEPKKRS